VNSIHGKQPHALQPWDLQQAIISVGLLNFVSPRVIGRFLPVFWEMNLDSRSWSLAGNVGPLASAIREAVQSDLMDFPAGRLVAVPYSEGL